MAAVLLAVIVLANVFSLFSAERPRTDLAVTECAPEQYLAEYFNNVRLKDRPVLTRCEAEIAYDWGVNSPAREVLADQFSVRWSTTRNLSGGTYTVTAEADDSIAVRLNNAEIIPHAKSRGLATRSATVDVVAGEHTIVVEYYDLNSRAVARFTMEQREPAPNPTPEPVEPTPTPEPVEPTPTPEPVEPTPTPEPREFPTSEEPFAGRGPNAVGPGTLNLTSTYNSIGVELFFTGDDNQNAVAALAFKRAGENTWREGLPLWGTYSSEAPGRAFYGSALLLDAGTTYEIRVSFYDPDGINGSFTATGSITTRADNIQSASSLIPTHFVGTTGSDSNSGTSPDNAWLTLEKAFKSAPSGAVVQVAPGRYAPPIAARTLPMTLAGTPGAIIESGVVAEPKTGAWVQERFLGPGSGKRFTAWCWNGVANEPDVLTVAVDANALPLRVANWAKKQGTFNGYTLQTPAGWVEALYVNDIYNYGFAAFPNGNGTSKVCARLNGDADPNTYRTVAHDGKKAGGAIVFSASNVRITGLEIRNARIQFDATANNGIVDHNRLILADVYYRADDKTNTYPTDHLIEHNQIIDTGLWSIDPSQPAIARRFIKHNVTIPGTDVKWNRVGENMETTAVHGRGGANGLVVRHNTIDGTFNGVGAYAQGFDRYAKRDYDIHDNLLRHIPDDAFEPDLGAINFRIWNNRVEYTPIIVSLGPTSYGPVYVFRNTIWNMGNYGVGETNNGETGIAGAVFKYSGNSTPQALVYFINNTVWSDQSLTNGAGQFAGGGDSPEAFIYRNNIVRVTRYALQTPAPEHVDEDYNYWFTPDPKRGISIGGITYTSIEAYRAGTGMGANSNVAGGFRDDPVLVDPANGDLQLPAGSALIDAGVVVPNISDTFTGSAPDLGSAER